MNGGIDQIKDPIEKAKEEILFIRQQTFLMGANDSEYSQFKDVLQKLAEGIYTPEEAIRLATLIKDRKADYH